MKQIQENLTVLLKLSGYILEGCNLEIIWEMDLKFWYVILKGKISGNLNIYWCFEFYTNLLRHNSKKNVRSVVVMWCLELTIADFFNLAWGGVIWFDFIWIKCIEYGDFFNNFQITCCSCVMIWWNMALEVILFNVILLKMIYINFIWY